MGRNWPEITTVGATEYREKTCKQAKLTAGGCLDRTQEVRVPLTPLGEPQRLSGSSWNFDGDLLG
jgi:hypothetical protein